MNKQFETPQEILAELGERVAQLRIRRDLTQVELSDRAGISPRALGDLERGQGSSLLTYVSVLKALGALHTLDALAPQPQVSPLAMLRTQKAQPQRVRRSKRDIAE